MKMKYIYIIGILLLTVTLGCQEDDFEFGDIVTPTNLQVTVSVAVHQLDTCVLEIFVLIFQLQL